MGTTTTTKASTSGSTSCLTSSGPAVGQTCVFPFTWNGVTHNTCADWIYGGQPAVPDGVPPRLTVQATMSMVRDFMDSVLTLVPSQLSHLRSFRLSVSEIRLPAKMLSNLENPMSNPVNK